MSYKSVDYLFSCPADVYYGSAAVENYCLGYTLGVQEAPRVNTKTKVDFFGQHKEVLLDYFIEVVVNLTSISDFAKKLFWKLGFAIGSVERLNVPIGLELGTEVRNILWLKPLDSNLKIVKYPCAYPKPSGIVPYNYNTQIVYPITFVCIKSFRTNLLREEYKQS